MTRLPASVEPILRRTILLVSALALLAAGARLTGAAGTSATAATTAAETSAARKDRNFVTTADFRTEVRTLVRLLDKIHYNRDAVRSTDYPEIITNFMGDLDGQRLFFLGSDKAEFLERHEKSLYFNINNLGNIDAAFQIFARYDERTSARIRWIFQELERDFDLSTNEYYRPDRSESEWPENAAAADELWRRRLKYELLAEVLNDKSTEEAKQAVRKRYERRLKIVSEIDSTEVAETFLSSLTRLYDPHSTYFSADTFEDFGIQMKLKLVGIGALLGIEEDYCVVKEIIPGGPADLSKQLRPNDKIISVGQSGADPVEIVGMKLRKIVEMIRGEKGTQVHLTVRPAEAPDPAVRKEIVLTRDVVKLNQQRARAAIFEVPDHEGKMSSIGVITLPAFYNSGSERDESGEENHSASRDVEELIRRLRQAGINGLVLDLRHNGGGLLSEAIRLTGLFIDRGPVVQIKDYENKIVVDRDNDPSIAYSGPLAVLVNRFSASASEIVAGALQNYGRAVVIGDSSTHGKGTVQTIVEMGSFVSSPIQAGAAKLTIQKFYLPSGSSTQLKGVVPDIVLPSLEDFLPVGESDLPRALVWDEIPTSFFNGRPLDPKVLNPLREASLNRQTSLEEFAYLKRNVEWFKTRQEQKLVPLNLDLRQKQKEADDLFRKEMKAERERLAKGTFTFKEFWLGPPPPKKTKPAPAAAEEEESLLSTDEEGYSAVDVHLRESLRVISDALTLARSSQQWANDQAPLTALTSKKG